jgi:hypothetical protein
MLKKFNWTTGPVRSSLGYDSTLIVLTNWSLKTQTVQIRFYNLDFSPKKKLISRNITLPSGATQTIDTQEPGIKTWEVQISTDSSQVNTWIGGRRLNSNLPGNIILGTELQKF